MNISNKQHKIEIFRTNEERAKTLGLKAPPTVKGYFWKKEIVEGVITHNRKWEESVQEGTRQVDTYPKLLAMFLDMTPSCGLNCNFCYSSREPLRARESPKKALNRLEIEYCIDVGQLFGVQTVVLAGRGEPTGDENFMHLVNYATKNDMQTVVFTHNMNITSILARELAALNVSVIGKLGSLNPAVQDRIVGKKGAHMEIYAGLQILLNAGFASPRLAVDATIMKSTLEDLKQVFVYCRQNNIIPYFEALIMAGNALLHPYSMKKEQLSPEELVAFFKELREIDETKYGYTWVITPGMHSLAYEDCKKNLTTISVRENGEVNTCVNERDTKIGSIRKGESLKRLICNSPTLMRIRQFGAPCCSTTCGSTNIVTSSDLIASIKK